MDLEDYLKCDPEIRILNRSIVANINIMKQQTNDQQSRKRGNWLLRQEIVDHTPEYTPKCIILTQLLFGIICLSFGIPMVIKKKDSYIEVEYDNWYLYFYLYI